MCRVSYHANTHLFCHSRVSFADIYFYKSIKRSLSSLSQSDKSYCSSYYSGSLSKFQYNVNKHVNDCYQGFAFVKIFALWLCVYICQNKAYTAKSISFAALWQHLHLTTLPSSTSKKPSTKRFQFHFNIPNLAC